MSAVKIDTAAQTGHGRALLSFAMLSDVLPASAKMLMQIKHVVPCFTFAT
jgi:hypothetical protein